MMATKKVSKGVKKKAVKNTMDKTKENIQKKVTIYSTPTCHFCHMAKDFFEENKIAYTNYDVSTDLEKRREMMDKTGQMGVPVIVIGDETMIGFDEERLKSLLGIK